MAIFFPSPGSFFSSWCLSPSRQIYISLDFHLLCKVASLAVNFEVRAEQDANSGERRCDS